MKVFGKVDVWNERGFEVLRMIFGLFNKWQYATLKRRIM